MNCLNSREEKCSELLLRKLLLRIPADYSWTDAGIVRIGASEDIAAYTVGDFRGYCLIFCHGNGETAVSERYWFEQLAKAGVSVICPDYRGYGLSEGVLSEQGCYTAAHAAYEWLVDVKRVPFEQGRAVFTRIASKTKRFVPVKGADHCTFQYFLGEKYVPLLVDFIHGKVGSGFFARLREWFG